MHPKPATIQPSKHPGNKDLSIPVPQTKQNSPLMVYDQLITEVQRTTSSHSKDQIDAKILNIRSQCIKNINKNYTNNVSTNIHHYRKNIFRLFVQITNNDFKLLDDLYEQWKGDSQGHQCQFGAFKMNNQKPTEKQSQKNRFFGKEHASPAKRPHSLAKEQNTQTNHENFIKTSLSHYYQQFINLRVMIIQESDKIKDFERFIADEIWFENKQYKKSQIMYPAPYSAEDFKFNQQNYIYELSDINRSNIYKSSKSKNLIFLKIPIIKLIQFFVTQLPSIFLRFEQPLSQVKSQAKKLFPEYLNPQHERNYYETLSLLIEVAMIIHSQISQKKLAKKEFITETNQKGINNKKSEQLRGICQENLLKFVQYVSFYNFTICFYESFQKQKLPIQNYISLNSIIQSKQYVSYTDLKIQLFLSVFRKPQLLNRILSESIANNKIFSKTFSFLSEKHYNFDDFYQNLNQNNDESKIAQHLSNYMVNFLQYSIELIQSISQPLIVSLNIICNPVRYILIFLLSVFTKKVMSKIQRQILYSYGPFVNKKVQEYISKEKNKKYQGLLLRLEQAIKISFKKIEAYQNHVGSQNGTQIPNIKKIKQLKNNNFFQSSSKNIIQFIHTLFEANQKPQNLQPDEDNKMTLLIYEYIIKLVATQYLCNKNFVKLFTQLFEQNFNVKNQQLISFQDFIENKPIQQWKTKIQKLEDFKSIMNKFEGEFKVANIQMIKIYLMTVTLWCYSFANVEDASSKMDCDLEKYKDLFTHLNALYIVGDVKITAQYLKERNIQVIEQILKSFILKANIFNDFCFRINQNQANTNEIRQLLMIQTQPKRQIVVPVHLGEVSYQFIEIEKDLLTEDSAENSKITRLTDLNKLMNRRLHKNKLSIFSLEDSRDIAINIHQLFSSKSSIMLTDYLQAISTLTYSYTDNQGEIYHSKGLKKQMKIPDQNNSEKHKL